MVDFVLLNPQALCYFPEGSRKLAEPLPRTKGSFPQKLWISRGGNTTTEESPEGEGGNITSGRLVSTCPPIATLNYDLPVVAMPPHTTYKMAATSLIHSRPGYRV
jgi:hypothetical protein